MTDQLRFDSIPTMKRSADFSPCQTWRYTLIREWDDQLPRLLFVLLNPSTADAEHDDPTNRKGIGFARRWGYGAAVFVNLFAIRSPYPRRILEVDDPIGPDNDAWIRCEALLADRIVVAWGTHGNDDPRHPERPSEVLKLILRPLYCLGTTKHGHPGHPLYIPYVKKLEEFDS